MGNKARGVYQGTACATNHIITGRLYDAGLCTHPLSEFRVSGSAESGANEKPHDPI